MFKDSVAALIALFYQQPGLDQENLLVVDFQNECKVGNEQKSEVLFIFNFTSTPFIIQDSKCTSNKGYKSIFYCKIL